jgi:hypothetical protein
MLIEFQCSMCRHVKLEPYPITQDGNRLLCGYCVKREPPPTTEWSGRPAGWQKLRPPPAMRGGAIPHAPGVSVTMVILVFLIGVAVGAKMAGGW